MYGVRTVLALSACGVLLCCVVQSLSPASWEDGEGQEELSISRLEPDVDTFQSRDYSPLMSRAIRIFEALKRREVARRAEALGKPIRSIRKRHCWDVTDVCCMWNC